MEAQEENSGNASEPTVTGTLLLVCHFQLKITQIGTICDSNTND